MTSELLPCPFCGGEAEILTAESMHGGYLFGIMCNDCRSRGDVFDTEAEAIEAWNTRAERTCMGESDLSEWVCSECQCWIPTGITHENKERVSTWNYCPHCGAKVVSE